MNNVAVTETLKTIGRGIWFSLLGIVVLILTAITTSPSVIEATLTLPVIGTELSAGTAIVAATAMLTKIIDRYIHTSKKTSIAGIAPKFLQR